MNPNKNDPDPSEMDYDIKSQSHYNTSNVKTARPNFYSKSSLNKVIQRKELKVMISKELRDAQDKQTFSQGVKRAPLYKILNNPESINLEKYRRGRSQQEQSSRRYEVVQEMVTKRGIGQKYSKEEIKHAGFNFENYHVTNSFKFFIHCEPALVKYLGKNGINLYSKRKDDIYFNKSRRSQYFNVEPKVKTYLSKSSDSLNNLFNLIRRGRNADFMTFKDVTVMNQTKKNKRFPYNAEVDEFGWNILHFAAFYNRPKFINWIVKTELVDVRSQTSDGQNVLMLYGKYLDDIGFNMFYRKDFGVDCVDKCGRNLVFNLVEGALIDFDKNLINQHIADTHECVVVERLSEINYNEYDTEKYKGINVTYEVKKKNYDLSTLILQYSTNKYILNREMMERILNKDVIKNGVKIGFDINYVKLLMMQQLMEAIRIINILEKLKEIKKYNIYRVKDTDKEQDIKEEEQEQEQDNFKTKKSNSKFSKTSSRSSKKPNYSNSNGKISEYIEFLDRTDNFNKKPIEIVLDSMNIFLILYFLLVNKIEISEELIEKFQNMPRQLDVHRLTMYYVVYHSDLLPASVVAWLEESNLLNIYVYFRNKVSLKFNPYEHHLYRWNKTDDSKTIQKKKIFQLLKLNEYEKYYHCSHDSEQPAQDLMAFYSIYKSSSVTTDNVDHNISSDEESVKSMEYKGYIDDKCIDKYYMFEHDDNIVRKVRKTVDMSKKISTFGTFSARNDTTKSGMLAEKWSLNHVGETLIKDFYESNGLELQKDLDKFNRKLKRPKTADPEWVRNKLSQMIKVEKKNELEVEVEDKIRQNFHQDVDRIDKDNKIYNLNSCISTGFFNTKTDLKI